MFVEQQKHWILNFYFTKNEKIDENRQKLFFSTKFAITKQMFGYHEHTSFVYVQLYV